MYVPVGSCGKVDLTEARTQVANTKKKSDCAIRRKFDAKCPRVEGMGTMPHDLRENFKTCWGPWAKSNGRNGATKRRKRSGGGKRKKNMARRRRRKNTARANGDGERATTRKRVANTGTVILLGQQTTVGYVGSMAIGH